MTTVATTTTTLEIKQIKDKPIDEDTTEVSVDLSADGVLHVYGDGLSDRTVLCILAGGPRSHSQQRIGQRQHDGCWEVAFDVTDVGTYALTCTATKSGTATLTIKVTAVPPSTAPVGLVVANRCLAITSSSFQYLSITGHGSVLNSANSVSCSLTPIKADGTSRGASQSSPAVMNGTSWTVMFTPSPAPPGKPPNQYIGLYLLEATAPNEGTDSITDTPPDPAWHNVPELKDL
jgi:hypothetical protein